MATDTGRTADHYADQWSPRRGFRDFITNDEQAASAMPAAQLGWAELFERIREEAAQRPVAVYDAGCGPGLIMEDLLKEPAPKDLRYLGADVNPSVLAIPQKPGATMKQWNMADPLPDGPVFDYVLCRAALHHTPDPAKSLETLVSHVAPDGMLALSVYAKKPPMREAVDDALRAMIVPMPNEEAWNVARQFSILGRDLQESKGKIHISQDVPFLGIKAGEYDIQSFIYDHFMKCWYNPAFGEKHSDTVNFDWYHPPYAYRFTIDEIVEIVEEHGLTVDKVVSIKAQHYVEARRSA